MTHLSTRTSHGSGGTVIVTITGEIDLSNADTLRTVLLSAVTGPDIKLLVCDLSNVDFLSCSGLSVILAVRSTVAEQGTELRLVTRTRVVRRLLTVSGVLDSLNVHSHLAAALTFGQRQWPGRHGRGHDDRGCGGAEHQEPVEH